VILLVLPVKFEFDNAVKKERRIGLLTKEKVASKMVTWRPYLDCVLNMEPCHSKRRVAMALAVDWIGLAE